MARARIKTTPKDEPQPDPRPMATDKEKERNARAERVMQERYADRPKAPKLDISVRDNGAVAVTNGHQDEDVGFAWRFCEALGANSSELASLFSTQLSNGLGVKAEQVAEVLPQGMAFMAELAPQNGVEGALGVQMWAIHCATVELCRRMRSADTLDRVHQYTNAMNKTARTFAAQVEALTKLRSGGKQQVEVRYVYVDARTQTVINPPGGPGGAGGVHQIGDQPHVALPHVPGLPAASGAAMWSEDPSREAMPATRDARQAPLSSPRREKSGRAQRAGERQLSPRTADQ
jgi:hypothetical protein